MIGTEITDVRGNVINVGDVVLINDDYDFYVRHVKSVKDLYYQVVTDPTDSAIGRRSHEICHRSSEVLVIKPSMSIYSMIDSSFRRDVVGEIKVGEDVVFQVYNDGIGVGKVTFVGTNTCVVDIGNKDFGISKPNLLPLRELLP